MVPCNGGVTRCNITDPTLLPTWKDYPATTVEYTPPFLINSLFTGQTTYAAEWRLQETR